eukprot:TRINITY_DN2716_c3_g1_i2.p4 TRINITY_DN2716_c3_g1~~TRINITY_DN2716_c3_g1_i2.p4  ORF type:complete len:217 (+),score=-11.62 TRINITY_DN2716_c3_g1_i2:494-1144(+)
MQQIFISKIKQNKITFLLLLQFKVAFNIFLVYFFYKLIFQNINYQQKPQIALSKFLSKKTHNSQFHKNQTLLQIIITNKFMKNIHKQFSEFWLIQLRYFIQIRSYFIPWQIIYKYTIKIRINLKYQKKTPRHEKNFANFFENTAILLTAQRSQTINTALKQNKETFQIQHKKRYIIIVNMIRYDNVRTYTYILQGTCSSYIMRGQLTQFLPVDPIN